MNLKKHLSKYYIIYYILIYFLLIMWKLLTYGEANHFDRYTKWNEYEQCRMLILSTVMIACTSELTRTNKIRQIATSILSILLCFIGLSYMYMESHEEGLILSMLCPQFVMQGIYIVFISHVFWWMDTKNLSHSVRTKIIVTIGLWLLIIVCNGFNLMFEPICACGMMHNPKPPFMITVIFCMISPMFYFSNLMLHLVPYYDAYPIDFKLVIIGALWWLFIAILFKINKKNE